MNKPFFTVIMTTEYNNSVYCCNTLEEAKQVADKLKTECDNEYSVTINKVTEVIY